MVVKEEDDNIDASTLTKKQISKEMTNAADVIISMVPQNELPNYIDSKKITCWNISNPKGTSMEFHRKVREQISKKIKEFLKNCMNA